MNYAVCFNYRHSNLKYEKNLLLFLWFCASRKTIRTTNFLFLFERLIRISNC